MVRGDFELPERSVGIRSQRVIWNDRLFEVVGDIGQSHDIDSPALRLRAAGLSYRDLRHG